MLLIQSPDWLYKYLDNIILRCLFVQNMKVFKAQKRILIRFWPILFEIKFLFPLNSLLAFSRQVFHSSGIAILSVPTALQLIY